jgi:hypothetical protein
MLIRLLRHSDAVLYLINKLSQLLLDFICQPVALINDFDGLFEEQVALLATLRMDEAMV